MNHVIEYDCKCSSCKGTGLYIGMAESCGAAVVCSTCRGTGKRHIKIEYEDFDGLIERHDVRRVIQWNPGIGVDEGNGYKLEDFGGMDYADWLQNKPFPAKSEMRRFTCPYWWYQGDKEQPHWEQCSVHGGQSFKQCPVFEHKDLCWQKWDNEFGGTP